MARVKREKEIEGRNPPVGHVRDGRAYDLAGNEIGRVEGTYVFPRIYGPGSRNTIPTHVVDQNGSVREIVYGSRR